MISFFKKYKFQLFILLFTSIVIYGKTINYEYVIDDKTVISQNKYVQEGISAIPTILKTSYWEGYANEVGMVYRPVPLISYVLSNTILSNTAKSHHLVNVILWIICLVLLYYFLIKHLLKGYNTWHILFVCLLWSVLPTNVEAIANIKGRDDVLCLLFGIISLIYLYKSIIFPNFKNLIIGGFFIVLSFFSKETSIILFPIIIGILYIKSSLFKNWKIICSYTFFFILALLIRQLITNDSVSIDLVENNTVLAFSGIEKLYFQLFLILEYHIKLLVPINLSWDYSYGYFEIKNYLFEAIISLIILTLLGYKFVKSILKKEIDAIYIVWYVSGILLVSNLLFIIGSTFADRFLFVPSIGLVLWFVSFIYNFNKLKEYKIYLLIVMTMIYGTVSYNRVSDWESDKTLITADYNKKNTSFRTDASYYEFKIVEFQNNTKNIELQKELDLITKEILKKYPDIESIWNLSGDYYKSLKAYDKALNSFKHTIEINPKSYTGYANYGFIYQETKDYDKAISSYLKAIEINPNKHLPYSNLGMIYHIKEDYLEAKKYYEKSLSIHKNNPTIVQNLANANHAIDIYDL